MTGLSDDCVTFPTFHFTFCISLHLPNAVRLAGQFFSFWLFAVIASAPGMEVGELVQLFHKMSSSVFERLGMC